MAVTLFRSREKSVLPIFLLTTTNLPASGLADLQKIEKRFDSVQTTGFTLWSATINPVEGCAYRT